MCERKNSIVLPDKVNTVNGRRLDNPGAPKSLFSEQLYNLLFYILEISNELFLFSRNFKKKTMKESIQRIFLTLSSLHQSSVHQYNQVSLVQVGLSSRLCHRMYLPVLNEVKQNI